MKLCTIMRRTLLFAALATTAGAAAPAKLPDPPRLPEQPELLQPPPMPTGPARPDEAYGSISGSRYYRHCLDLVNSNPDSAYDQARLWRDQGGGAPAEHCAAMALARLGHLEEAAKRLSQAAAGHAPVEAPLRAEIYSQAGLLWLLTRKPQQAYEAFSQALAAAPADDPARAQYHFDRAQAAANLGRWRDAADDLTRTLALGRSRVDAFVLRARAHRALGDLVSAGNDVDAALILDPANAEALLERGQVRQEKGDVKGARADWLRVRARDDAPELQEAANQKLAELDAKALRTCAPESPEAGEPGDAQGVHLNIIDCPR